MGILTRGSFRSEGLREGFRGAAHVELLLRKLAEGATQGDLLAAYPRLQAEDIAAALAYAAETIAHETVLLPKAG